MLKASYPKSVTAHDRSFVLRLMESRDRNAILTLAQSLSEADLLFMHRDITQPEAVDEWVRDVEAGRAVTVLAEENGKIIGYGTLYYNQIFWHRHLAEIRIMVSEPYRNWGLEETLTGELVRYARDLRLDKVITYLTVEDKGTQRVAEELGFRPEALLTDWVKTRDNCTHDMLIMVTSLTDMQN